MSMSDLQFTKSDKLYELGLLYYNKAVDGMSMMPQAQEIINDIRARFGYLLYLKQTGGDLNQINDLDSQISSQFLQLGIVTYGYFSDNIPLNEDLSSLCRLIVSIDEQLRRENDIAAEISRSVNFAASQVEQSVPETPQVVSFVSPEPSPMPAQEFAAQQPQVPVSDLSPLQTTPAVEFTAPDTAFAPTAELEESPVVAPAPAVEFTAPDTAFAPTVELEESPVVAPAPPVKFTAPDTAFAPTVELEQSPVVAPALAVEFTASETAFAPTVELEESPVVSPAPPVEFTAPDTAFAPTVELEQSPVVAPAPAVEFTAPDTAFAPTVELEQSPVVAPAPAVEFTAPDTAFAPTVELEEAPVVSPAPAVEFTAPDSAFAPTVYLETPIDAPAPVAETAETDPAFAPTVYLETSIDAPAPVAETAETDPAFAPTVYLESSAEDSNAFAQTEELNSGDSQTGAAHSYDNKKLSEAGFVMPSPQVSSLSQNVFGQSSAHNEFETVEVERIEQSVAVKCSCGYENPKDSLFCGFCGKKLM